MFDEETERLCREIDLDIALPPAALRTRLNSKIETTRIGNAAGVASVPNVLGKANSYSELTALAKSAKLGRKLVVQTPYGDSGRTTFFISSEDDWKRYAPKIVDQDLKVMKQINHLPGTIEGCATRHGTLVGPVMTDITGYAEITPYKGGWCGNDVSPTILPEGVPEKVREMARKFGDRLYAEGYKGVFCLDFLLDTDTNTVYLGELNPRVSGATPPTNLMTDDMCAVGINGVTKRFGEAALAVDDLDLQIRDGEFFSLLGPSGCGKTTTLRMIAGLEFPTEGSIRIFGEEMGLRPPNKRPVNTVFQSYALFPHMTVEQNVVFGLEMQDVPKAEARSRAGRRHRPGAPRRDGQAQARPAVRRPAAAGGTGPGAGQPAEGAAPRRAAGGARPQAAPGDADRAEGDPAAGGHHLRVRHPRPGGGAHHVRPDRGDERGQAAPGRPVRGHLRASQLPGSSPSSSARPTSSRGRWSGRTG